MCKCKAVIPDKDHAVENRSKSLFYCFLNTTSLRKNTLYISSMVDIRISPNIMKPPPPSPKCYVTFYSDTHWSDISLNRDLVTELDLITVFDVITTFATGSASKQWTITPPDSWSYPILELAFVLMLRTFFSELVMSTDLLSFDHPSLLLFCLPIV